MNTTFNSAKNAFALARASVARKEVELRLAQLRLDEAATTLEREIALLGKMPPTNLYITNGGPNKIATIKMVREITNLGLKEAKDLVDAAGAPCPANCILGPESRTNSPADPKSLERAAKLLAPDATTVIL